MPHQAAPTLPLTLLALVSSCSSCNEACIEVPSTSRTEDHTALVDLSAKLLKVPLDASLSTGFKSTTQIIYQRVSDKTAALTVTLRAIHCLLVAAKTPEQAQIVKDATPELIKIARGIWLESKDIRGASQTLTPAERDALTGPAREAALAELLKIGVK